jgi:hypothetical protein
MQARSCPGALSPKELQELEEDADLRLYTCAVCGKRNLYSIKDRSGRWVPEPHHAPLPAKRKRGSASPAIRD